MHCDSMAKNGFYFIFKLEMAIYRASPYLFAKPLFCFYLLPFCVGTKKEAERFCRAMFLIVIVFR